MPYKNFTLQNPFNFLKFIKTPWTLNQWLFFLKKKRDLKVKSEKEKLQWLFILKEFW